MSEPSRLPDQAPLRASDADRSRVIDVLAGAAAEGRITLEEYSERSETALGARTLGELASLTADLPASPARGAVSPAAEQIATLLGNETRKGSWVVPARLTVRSVLGDCHIEMQHAVIRQQVTTIEATVRFGSVTIYVPDGIEVRLSGRSVLGSKSSELYREPRPGAPVIDVRCDVFCGAVNVRRPEPRMR
jgi:Domain of unknown function (DUF1707)/Cell wall-active antibiotics response 4TMS YvqF